MSDALVVLMRWPREGEGKTRLAAQIGSDAAHRLHHAFVADTLGWPSPRPRLLAVSPADDDAVRAARTAAPDAAVVRQPPGNLGRRIAGALEAALLRGARRAVLVGTDSPSLPHRLVAACLDMAGAGDIGMVPADDGGFVALAVHRDAAERHGLRWLHRGIDWSTARACAQTGAAAERAGLRTRLTAAWYDVDEVGDLDRLAADLRRDPARAPQTLRRLRERSDADAVDAAAVAL